MWEFSINLKRVSAKCISLLVAQHRFHMSHRPFGYSFSKAQAAAFAAITYWSAWLRCYHPTAFFAGLLRHQPMGFYPVHVVVTDARHTGVKILPVDLRYSQAQPTLERNAIRLGLDCVRDFGPEHIELLLDERRCGLFRSLADLVWRTALDRRRVESLVLAGALDYLGERRQLLWDIAEAYRVAKRPRELPVTSPEERAALTPMDASARMVTSFAATGVALEAHLTELRRDAFTRAGVKPIQELTQMRNGQAVTIGGLVVALQRPPTASGYCFLAVEDSEAMVNVVVAPDVYAQCRQAIHGVFVIVEGVVQHDHGAINVVAKKISEV